MVTGVGETKILVTTDWALIQLRVTLMMEMEQGDVVRVAYLISHQQNFAYVYWRWLLSVYIRNGKH